MKRYIKILALLTACVTLIVSLVACTKGNGIPFLSTKNRTSAAPNTVTVTFPEGYTVIDIAKRLEENGVCSADDFMAECNKPYDGITIDNANDRIFLLEGYIFPDTYEFYLNSSASSVIKTFIDNYNAKVTDEIKAQANKLGYTMDEMLTLASIIQKECDKDTAECANVSSVFHNRLKNPSFPKLQSDVTTFYITKNLGEYLEYDSNKKYDEQNDGIKHYMELYSTYYCNGLPVGPICNPGIKAIKAAVNPADTEYLYFLTDSTGEKFYYASTIAQHNANGKAVGLF